MNRRHIILVTLAAILCGIVAATVHNLASANEPANIQLIVVVPDTVTSQLPTGCVKEVNGDCKAWLGWAWALQRATPNEVRLDLWAKATGSYYHAHALRRKVGTNWVWHIFGPRVWFELFKAWKLLQPEISLYQPHSVLTAPALCNQLAEAWFVDITADSGIRAPLPDRRSNCAGPSDAGPGDCMVTPRSWPDGSTVNCGTPTPRWWLIRSRWGGPAPQPWSVSSDAGYGATTVARPRGTQALTVPDARTTKTCHNVPIGVSCP
jgi:hypothetical protein